MDFDLQNDEEPDWGVAKLVRLILTDAARRRASDVYFDPEAALYRVSFRIDEVLQTVATLPRDLKGPVASRIKSLAGLDIASRPISQRGRMRVRISDSGTSHDLEVVVSIDPGRFGYKIWIEMPASAD